MKWSTVLVVGSIALQVLVIYVPFMQRAFGTVGLSGPDWAFSVAVSSSVLWIRELTQVATRAKAH